MLLLYHLCICIWFKYFLCCWDNIMRPLDIVAYRGHSAYCDLGNALLFRTSLISACCLWAKGCSSWNLCSDLPVGIFMLHCDLSSSLFFLIYVQLFQVTFLSETVCINFFFYASCFFTSGREEKLVLPAETEKKETGPSLFQTSQPAENVGIALSRHTWTQSLKHTQTRAHTWFFHIKLLSHLLSIIIW